MKNQNKVLIIGLDGATWTVLKPWMDKGHLPHLTKLAESGCWGDLRSILPPLSAPAWSSFLTGKNPGKHGVYHFVTRDQTDIVDGRSIKSPTLWDIVAHHGRKVGVINVPMSYPPRPVNGFMITGLLTPPEANTFTYPPELSQKLVDYQIDLDRFIEQKPFASNGDQPKQKRIVKPSIQLMQEFYDMEDKRGQTALELMDTEPWDVFMVVFTATDRMGHYLWPYHRADDLDGSSESLELHEAIYRFYVHMDTLIGHLVEKAGEDVSVVVMSDHGMGPIYSKNTHWNNWLYKQGYLQIDKSSTSTPDGWLLRLGVPRDKLSSLAKGLGLSRSKAVQKIKNSRTATIDFNRSKAYYVRMFDPVGGIWINAEGQEKEALRDELMAAIKAVVDPTAGKPIVRWIFRREECYQGPYANDAPDIILVMHPDYGSSDRLSNYSAIVTDRSNISDPGGHHIEGIFIAKGQDIATKAEAQAGLCIEDVAPTVLYLMGLPVPSDMDGRVLTELLKPDSLKTRPVLTSDPLSRWPDEEATFIEEDFSCEDEEAVRDRLRALGYFE